MLSIQAASTYHCIQFAVAGVNLASSGLDWVFEGSAEWVGSMYHGATTPTLKDNWTSYIENRRALYARDYDAIGFFAHLNTLRDVWSQLQLLNPMLRVGLDNGMALQGAVNVGGDDVLKTWSTSVFREDDLGPSWDVHGVGVPALVNFSPVRPSDVWAVRVGQPLTHPLKGGMQFLVTVDVELPQTNPDEEINLSIQVEGGYGGIAWRPGTDDEFFGPRHTGNYLFGTTSCDGAGKLPIAPTQSFLLGATGIPRLPSGTLKIQLTTRRCGEQPGTGTGSIQCVNPKQEALSIAGRFTGSPVDRSTVRPDAVATPNRITLTGDPTGMLVGKFQFLRIKGTLTASMDASGRRMTGKVHVTPFQDDTGRLIVIRSFEATYDGRCLFKGALDNGAVLRLGPGSELVALMKYLELGAPN